MLNAGKVGDRVDADVVRGAQSALGVAIAGRYEIECYAPDGTLKWREVIENLVVDAGLNDMLGKWLKGSTYTAAFYVGLTDGTPTAAAGDTMSSHAGWAEVTAYDEAARQALTLGSVASKSVSNSASKAAFTCSTNATTVGGVFITTVSTKGGTTGTLISVGAFTAGGKSLDDGDTLNAQVTYTASSS